MSPNESIDHLLVNISDKKPNIPIPFHEFFEITTKSPEKILRNVFQLTHDMAIFYLGKGYDDYPDDPQSVNYLTYDSLKLFVEGADKPFFADTLFANRLVNLVKSFKESAPQNRIFLFQGPHGSGKSTFLTNFLLKLEEYANSDNGLLYEAIWKLNLLDNINKHKSENLEDHIFIPCPSHDNPLLIIPKKHRRQFLQDSQIDDAVKKNIFYRKEYEWLLKDEACDFCRSTYKALLEEMENPGEVFSKLYARRYMYDRKSGNGISIFNPSDNRVEASNKTQILKNDFFQEKLDNIFKGSNMVKYEFSRFAKTNNGIYALMDVKDNNKDRFYSLHGILSEGIHKVGDIEENITSLFMGVINPEDYDAIFSEKAQKPMKSFLDRVSLIKIPYILDYTTETHLYKTHYGAEIENRFLPGVLENFAKVIISTRLSERSKTIQEWIKNPPSEYDLYCDKDFLLLKMEIYRNKIPIWLIDQHRNSFSADIRRSLLDESLFEGDKGLSGRQSLELFHNFYTKYTKKSGILIDMNKVRSFFSEYQSKPEYKGMMQTDFLKSLVSLYDYNVLQEVKESLFQYNKSKVSSNILNYIYALSYNVDDKILCPYTHEQFKVSTEFLEGIEKNLLGPKSSSNDKENFRHNLVSKFIANTLVREMKLEGKSIKDTSLYNNLIKKYEFHLKRDVLDKVIGNENFRSAVKDYGTEYFIKHDNQIKEDIEYLIKNLVKKFKYTEEGAQQVSIYILDKNLAKKFPS